MPSSVAAFHHPPARRPTSTAATATVRPRYPMAGQYLAAVRRAFAITQAGGRVRLFWSSPDLDAEGWTREFCAALDRRISRELPWYGLGRKWDPDWQRHARFDAERINAIGRERRRVYATEITTDDWRRRFADLYATPWD